MKLLSIGNSFSVDAQRWLYTLFGQSVAVDGMAKHDFDTALLEKIVTVVKHTVDRD